LFDLLRDPVPHLNPEILLQPPGKVSYLLVDFLLGVTIITVGQKIKWILIQVLDVQVMHVS